MNRFTCSLATLTLTLAGADIGISASEACTPPHRQVAVGERNRPSVAGVQGEYFADSRVATPGRWARDDVAAERLFHLAESLLVERGFTAVGRAA
jgi:hypothetical protein